MSGLVRTAGVRAEHNNLREKEVEEDSETQSQKMLKWFHLKGLASEDQLCCWKTQELQVPLVTMQTAFTTCTGDRFELTSALGKNELTFVLKTE